MNRYVALGCLGLGLLTSPLFAQFADSAVPASPKIGVIDMEKTLYETPAGKRANAAFDKNRKVKQEQLDKKQTELRKAGAELEKQAAVLKPDVLEAKKKELEQRFVELQQTYAKLERDLAEDRTKLVQDLLTQAGPIVKDIAKSQGVTVIFDQSAVLWSEPAVDLTPDLNARMK